MKHLSVIFGIFYFLGGNEAQDCKTCDYDAQTNEVMEFQVQVKNIIFLTFVPHDKDS